LPTTRHRYILDRGDGHRSLVTPERVLSEYKEDLIFFLKNIPLMRLYIRRVIMVFERFNLTHEPFIFSDLTSLIFFNLIDV